MSHQKPFPGRLLGIDHGNVYIGLATCDRSGLIATPHSVLERQSKKEDFAKINQLIEAEEIAGIVLGLPPRPPDFEGYSQQDTVRLWASRLNQAVEVSICFWDEGLSSADAAQLLAETGQTRPERIDAHAAAFILQSFLDAIREGQPWPEPLPVEESSEE
jgi:putative Holliday junction resolvase